MVNWTAPDALWLLALVPLVWLAPLAARTTFNRRQRALQAIARSLLLTVLVLAIARPVLSTTSPRQSIVYVVDVSHSIASRAIEEAARRIDDMNGALHPAWSRIVVFGSTTATVPDTAALRRLAPIDATVTESVDRSGSDLENALNAARGQLAPDSTPRIVLFSDGRPTGGRLESAIARLATAHIPVYVQPMAVRSLGDAWVDRIDLPPRLIEGAPFVATVTIGAQRAATGTLTLRADDDLVATRDVSLQQGLTPIELDARIVAAGNHVLRASIKVTRDPLEANNTLEAVADVTPRTRVLYVEGAPQSARYLTTALRDAGFDPIVIKPAASIPTTVAGFDSWDVVVLSDVARSAISDASVAALTPVGRKGWRRSAGCGRRVGFRRSGYQKSAIERIAPVTFERKDEPEVALVLVLDRSWSMAGPSIDLCKAAAQAAVDVLTDKQVVGIITFNDQYRLERAAQHGRAESREHSREDCRHRPVRADAYLPRRRTGVSRAAIDQGACEARRRAL